MGRVVMAADAKAFFGKVKRRRAKKQDDGMVEKTLFYLATQGDVWAERRNSGSQLVPKREGGFYRIHLGEPGTPDVTGYLSRAGKTAIPFGIEAKAQNGVLNPEQRAWHAKANKFGVATCVARELRQVVGFIDMLRGMP